jgi:hypothetical protein
MIRKVTQIACRRFLSSEAGMEMMLYLRQNTPGVAKGESHAMAFDAGVAEGYKIALNRIAEITPVEKNGESSVESPSLI